MTQSGTRKYSGGMLLAEMLRQHGAGPMFGMGGSGGMGQSYQSRSF